MHGRGSFTARGNWLGIHATEASRAPRDVRGRALSVQFRIQDPRPPVPGRTYEVAIRLEASSCTALRCWQAGRAQASTGCKPASPVPDVGALQGVGADEMLGPQAPAGEAPVIGVANTFTAPGVWSLDVPCPRTR